MAYLLPVYICVYMEVTSMYMYMFMIVDQTYLVQFVVRV